jgi:Bacterial Ig-like domain (group 3)/FG-GAP-like repeat
MFTANRFTLPAIALLLAAIALPMTPALLMANPIFKFSHIEYVSALGSPIVADVNGDGNNDLLLTNGDDVEVLLGGGDGTFISHQGYYGGSGIGALAIGDFNGDGKLDLAVIDSAGVAVLLGVGDGTFNPPQTIGSGTRQVAVGDINGDGKLDIVAPTSSGDIAVFLGNGDGTFQAAKLSSAGSVLQIALADVNLDHKLDVFVSGNAGVGVMLGNGDGTFQPLGSIDTTVVVSIGTADLRGDSKPDLVTLTGTPTSSTVQVYLGNGDGTFQAPVSYSAGGKYPVAMLVADANNDGRPDVLVAECPPSQYECYVSRTGVFRAGKGEIAVLLGSGGILQKAQLYQTGGKEVVSVALGDLNNDGRPDLISGNACEKGGGCTGSPNIGISIATGRYTSNETLVSNLNPSLQGQPVTFTATVSSPVKPLIPTGKIIFKKGGTKLAEVELSNGVATYTTDTLPVGSDSISADYFPGPDWYKTQASITQVVNP